MAKNIIKIEDLNKEDLYLEHVDCRWLYMDVPIYCFTTPFLDKTLPFSSVFPFVKGLELDWMTLKADQKKISEDLLEKDAADPNLFPDLYKKWYIKLEKMFSFYYECFQGDYSNFSDKALKARLEKMWSVYTKETVFPGMLDAFMFYADGLLNQLLTDFAKKEKTTEKSSLLFSILSAPIDDSFLNEVENELIDIALKMKKGIKIDDLIKKHCEKFSYINASYGDYQPYNVEMARAKIEEMIGQKKLLKSYPGKENQLKKQALLKKYAFSKEILQLVKLTELFTKWQDERKKLTQTHVCLEAKLIEEIGKRKKIDINLLKACFYSELGEILDGKEVPEAIKKRFSEPTLMVFSNGQKDMEIVGKKASDFLARIKGVHDSNINQIYGLTACPGNAVGKAKIVRTFEDTKKIEEGDILIIPMTRPEHTPAMKKSAAIVTDDGGITCHAAIIAREMKKPCIIGTKLATRVLKDGDLVDVRANHGLVKILKRANT